MCNKRGYKFRWFGLMQLYLPKFPEHFYYEVQKNPPEAKW